jgi:hypothetical protein
MYDMFLKILIVIWTIVGVGLSCYLVGFPIFMKKNIAEIVALLERIARSVEQKKRNEE